MGSSFFSKNPSSSHIQGVDQHRPAKAGVVCATMLQNKQTKMHQGNAFEKAVMVCVFDNRHRKLHGYDTGSCQVQQNWCADFYVRSHIVGNLSACCICITKTKSHNWFCVSGEVLNTRFFFIQRKTWLLNKRIPDMLGKSLSCMDIAKTWFGAVNTSHNDGMKAREVSRMTCTFMVFLFVLKRSRLPMFFASTIESC